MYRRIYSTANEISLWPSIPAVITSPEVTGPTPDGVPVKIRSPGSNVKIELIKLIISGTEKIISLVLAFCLISPLTFSQSCTASGEQMFSFGMNSPTGHEVSNPLQIDHGSLLVFNSSCLSLSVMSRAIVYPAMTFIASWTGVFLHCDPIMTPSSTSWCRELAPGGS